MSISKQQQITKDKRQISSWIRISYTTVVHLSGFAL